MNRNEAIAELIENGLSKRKAKKLVNQVEKMDCDFTSRLMQSHESHLVEFSATATEDGSTGVVAYYYQNKDEVNNTEDLGNLDWKIDHYDVF